MSGTLSGMRVVVTRPRHQAADLVRLLEERGGTAVLFPTIRIGPPADPAPLRRAAEDAHEYDWLVFTSVNGVAAFAGARDEVGLGPLPSAPSGPRVCAIGPATAEAAEEIGLEVDVVPERYVAEAALEALAAADDLEGRRILLPRAAHAREVLPGGLRERGARVDVVEAYRTAGTDPDAEALRRRLDAGEVQWITFTASSTVRGWHRLMGADLGGARAAAIGPITAGTAAEVGIEVDAVATEYTMPGLVRALERVGGQASGDGT